MIDEQIEKVWTALENAEDEQTEIALEDSEQHWLSKLKEVMFMKHNGN